MSKINAVRLININYNNNAIRISDEVMHFNGQSTLISLRNGGGKSVLVQMMTAPFVQKRYRNTKDRPFAGYFTSGRPSFILVEWTLEQGAGYVMTGMMVRQSQNTDDGEELEVVNFISEYTQNCLQDLHHLPVIEKTKNEVTLKSFAVCRQLFDTYKKDRSLRFFCYDMNNSVQAKQYFDKLLEYGINYREWQSIIKKVNEEESGLSKLFADCKDEKGLVEKWFLESVESKLNRDKNRMQEFRDILEKYTSLYRDNQSKIKRRDTIRKFDEEADRIAEQGSLYVNASDASMEALEKIASYINELNRIFAETEEEYSAEQALLEEISEKLQLVSRQRYSAEYYHEQDIIDSLTSSIASLASSLAELTAQRDSWTQIKNLLSCAKQQETVNDDKAELARAEAALEVCRREGQDLAPERDYLGFRIRRHLEGVIRELEERIRSTEQESSELNAAEKKANEEIDAIDRLLRKVSGEEGRLESAIHAYDNEEERFNKHWQMNLSRNIMREYEAGALTVLESELGAKAAQAAKTITQKKKTLENLSVQILKQDRDIDDLEIKRQEYRQKQSEAQAAKKAFDVELEERRKILQYLELRETSLYDIERIVRAADGKLAELDALVRKLTKEEADLAEKIENLTTGQAVEISPELSRMFEGLGIHIVYGMEWLKRNGQTEDENLKLVSHHPFLPYALLMSEAELKKLEKAEGSVYTSVPVPIITRESLAACQSGYQSGRIVRMSQAGQQNQTGQAGQMERTEQTERASLAAASDDRAAGFQKLGSTHFYMFFNQNLLNEEKLAQMLAQMQRDLERKQSELSHRKQEYDDYLIRKTTLLQQKVTEAAYRSALNRMADMEKALIRVKEEFAAAKQMLAKLNSQKENVELELNTLGKKADSLDRERQELQELAKSYAAYLRQLNELYECRKQLETAEHSKEKLKSQLELTRGKLRSLETSRTELRLQRDTQTQMLAGFIGYQEIPCPPSVQEDMLRDFTLMQARYIAITEQASKKEQELEADRKRAAVRLQKSEKELERLAGKCHFDHDDWLETHYSAAEEDHAEDEIRYLDDQIGDVTKSQNKADKDRALADQRQAQIVMRLERECGTKEPLPREDVPEIDFAEARNVLLHEKTEHEEASRKLTDRRQVLDQNITSLAEYQDYEVKNEQHWQEAFIGFSKEELRAYTGNLKLSYLQCQKAETEAKDKLVRILNQVIRIPDFQEDFYKKPLEAMLTVASDAHQVMEQLDVVRRAYHDLIEKLMADIAIVEQEKAHIVTLLQAYVKQVHDEIGKIDKNSTILVRGKPIKMLKIGLPAWADNENLYHVRVEDMIDDITGKGLAILDKNESLHEFMGKRMTTRELYDAVIGIGNVHIQLYKIEAQRELQISWSEVARNSGGEGFLSAFVILSSLLYYMRRDDTDVFADRNEGKVLLMDNPFAQTNASHLLKPLMDVAKKNNTQLICLTGLGGDSIYGRFDNIYALNLIAASLSSGVQHLKATHTRGEDPETLTFSRVEVADDGQMMMPF